MPRRVAPTACSATRTESGASAPTGGADGTVAQRTDATENIITIVSHSTGKPKRLTTMGAKMMKPKRNAPLNVNVKSEFATSRSFFGTIEGIIAASAGTKKIVAAATRKFTTYAAVTLSPNNISGTIAA